MRCEWSLVIEEKQDNLNYYLFPDRDEMGRFSAKLVSDEIKRLFKIKDEIRIIFVSAPSQDELLKYLILQMMKFIGQKLLAFTWMSI